MSIAVILLVVGVLAGLARGGRFENLGKLRFRWPWLVFLGLVLQISAELFAGFVFPNLRDDGRGLAILLSSYVLLIGFVIANRRVAGMLLIGAGLALNLLVIGVNDGMPVSVPAAEVAGFDPEGYLERAVKHRRMGPGTRLKFLGDIIPVPVLRNAVSIGDVVLGIGIFVMVERSIRYAPRRRRSRSGSSGPSEET